MEDFDDENIDVDTVEPKRRRQVIVDTQPVQIWVYIQNKGKDNTE